MVQFKAKKVLGQWEHFQRCIWSPILAAEEICSRNFEKGSRLSTSSYDNLATESNPIKRYSMHCNATFLHTGFSSSFNYLHEIKRHMAGVPIRRDFVFPPTMPNGRGTWVQTWSIEAHFRLVTYVRWRCL